MSKQFKADMVLVLIALVWGLAYLAIDVALGDMEPFNVNIFRFLIAFAVMIPVLIKKRSRPSRATVRYSIFIGIMLYLVGIGSTFGVKYTSLSNAGFLCSITVVFIPILAFLFKHKIPELKMVLAVIICTVGVALMTLTGSLKLGMGDAICLLCSVAYAFDMIAAEEAAKAADTDMLEIGIYQLLVAGILYTASSFIFETPHLPTTVPSLLAVLFLAVFASGFAFIGQVVAQKYTSAEHAGVIFALEPVFTAVFAFIFAHEVLTLKGYAGALLVLASILIVEINFKKAPKK